MRMQNMTGKLKEMTDKQKVYLLERILKNLYHGKVIMYRLHSTEGPEPDYDLYGYITITDVNTSTMPNICDICDPGLSENLHAEIREVEWRKEMRIDAEEAQIDVEIWFHGDINLKEEILEARIEQLEEWMKTSKAP